MNEGPKTKLEIVVDADSAEIYADILLKLQQMHISGDADIEIMIRDGKIISSVFGLRKRYL